MRRRTWRCPPAVASWPLVGRIQGRSAASDVRRGSSWSARCASWRRKKGALKRGRTASGATPSVRSHQGVPSHLPSAFPFEREFVSDRSGCEVGFDRNGTRSLRLRGGHGRHGGGGGTSSRTRSRDGEDARGGIRSRTWTAGLDHACHEAWVARPPGFYEVRKEEGWREARAWSMKRRARQVRGCLVGACASRDAAPVRHPSHASRNRSFVRVSSFANGSVFACAFPLHVGPVFSILSSE